MNFEKPLVLGATGPAGKALTRDLVDKELPVRVVSRSVSSLLRAFRSAELDRVETDALNAEALLKAVEGCDVVFHCVGSPPSRMADQREIAKNLSRAIQETGARCVYVSSYWSYLPVAKLPIDEDHPREGGNDIIKLRREAEDILQEAGAAVLNLPDFFGPEVHTGVLQQVFVDAHAKRNPLWFSELEVEREFVFVPDAMQAALQLSQHEEAYGKRWIVPGAGPTTLRSVLETVEQHLSRDVYARPIRGLMLRLTSLLDPSLRAFRPMAPYYAEPIRFDGSRLEELLGEVRITPYEGAVNRTLYWIRQNT